MQCHTCRCCRFVIFFFQRNDGDWNARFACDNTLFMSTFRSLSSQSSSRCSRLGLKSVDHINHFFEFLSCNLLLHVELEPSQHQPLQSRCQLTFLFHYLQISRKHIFPEIPNDRTVLCWKAMTYLANEFIPKAKPSKNQEDTCPKKHSKNET